MAAKLTQIIYNSFEAHSLGEITIQSQSGRFLPDKLGQKEIRQLHLKIESFEQDYDSNYNLMQQARAAFAVQNKVMTWITSDTELSDGTIIQGSKVLEHPVVIVSHDLPDDPNAWGTYNQAINIVVEYELERNTGALGLTFHRTDAGGSAVNMGHTHTFKRSYRASKYSELRNTRERAAGGVTATGEIFVSLPEASGGTDNRRSILQARVEALIAQVKGRDGTLLFGPSETPIFNKVVRVVSFDADVNQLVNGVEWSMTVDYTEFPDEAGQAAADFTYHSGEDRETGESVLSLSGRVVAGSSVLAMAKIDSLKEAVLKAAGYPAGLKPIKLDYNPRYINTNDTQTQSSGAATSLTADMGAVASPNVFLEMSFDFQWRKRSANLVSYTLQITDDDDTKTGLIHRSYTGTVVAGGATSEEAYNTAVAKAKLLGDKKHAYRLNAKITRTDRQIGTDGPIEFLEIKFSFDYQVKGVRIYLELTTETHSESFGEDGIRVSGFVVAPDYGSAKTAYQERVKALYSGDLIKSESTSDLLNTIQLGPTWVPNTNTKQFGTMSIRFDFNLVIWKPKVNTTFAVEYAVRIDIDYVAFRVNTSVEGTYWGSQANLEAAQNSTGGNPLDTFLVALGYGNRLSSSRNGRRERLGSSEFKMGLGFNATFIRKLSNASQILQCEVQEEIQYSGTRWQFLSTPDGVDVPQDCGIERGFRNVSGTVIATDETAAMTWVNDQRQLPFPTGIGGGAAPANRYLNPPKISRGFDYLPLDVGVARGESSNVQVLKMSFTFSEHLPSYSFVT